MNLMDEDIVAAAKAVLVKRSRGQDGDVSICRNGTGSMEMAMWKLSTLEETIRALTATIEELKKAVDPAIASRCRN